MSRNRSHDGSSLNPATVIFAALAARSISNGLLATDRSASIESSRQASCALRPSGQVIIQNCSLIGRPQYMQGVAWISRQRAWLSSLIASHLGEPTPGTISRLWNAEPTGSSEPPDCVSVASLIGRNLCAFGARGVRGFGGRYRRGRDVCRTRFRRWRGGLGGRRGRGGGRRGSRPGCLGGRGRRGGRGPG